MYLTGNTPGSTNRDLKAKWNMAADPKAAMAVMWHLKLQLGSAQNWEYMWEQKQGPSAQTGTDGTGTRDIMAVMGYLQLQLGLLLDWKDI